MEYMIGAVLAVVIGAMAAATGFDRDRVFYPTLLIVIAGYYILFAVIDGRANTITVETVIALGFGLLAVAGAWWNPWLVVIGLVAHGMFDGVHHLVISNAGVPPWWPGFCLVFDWGLAGWIGLLIFRRSDKG
ncbi:MAG: hypothetical protein AB1515_03515 [Nitrospirota bacterium]